MLVATPSTLLSASIGLAVLLVPNVAGRPSPGRPLSETEQFELVNRRLEPVPAAGAFADLVKRATTTKKKTTTTTKKKTTTTTKKKTTTTTKKKTTTTTKKAATSTKVKVVTTSPAKKTTTTTVNASAAAASSRNAYSTSSKARTASLAAALQSYSSSVAKVAASVSAGSLASFTRSSASAATAAAASFSSSSVSASSAASRYTSSSAAAATSSAGAYSRSSAVAYISSYQSALAAASRSTSLSSYSSSSAAASLSQSASLSSSRSASAAAAVKTLATGDSFVSGTISSTFRWQASGLLTAGCPWNVPNLDITTCYHLYLNATGNLQGSAGAATAKRDWDAEEDAALFDDHLESYFEAFPEQIPEHFLAHPDGRNLHKRQIASCADQVVSTVIPTTYTTVTTVVATSDVPAATATAAPVVVVDVDAASPASSSSSRPQAVLVGRDELTTDSYATTTTVVASVTFTSAVAATTTPASPRQRTELLSWPGAAAGSTWSYSWKSFQSAATGTGRNFFHSWQLLRRDFCGGPVVTLDYKNGQVAITDIVRPSCGGGYCPSVPVSQFFGKTVRHSLTVTYGLLGSLQYSVVDVADSSGTPLIAYTAAGDMGASGSIKFGEYRSYQTYLTDAEAFLGDYSAQRLS